MPRAPWGIIWSIANGRRSCRVAIRCGVAPRANIEIVGELPIRVARQLGIAKGSRVVRLGPDGIAHIRERRQRAPDDARLVLRTLRRGMLGPVYCGADLADPRRALIVEQVSSRPLWVCISLKFVAAGASDSGVDEIWVNTAYPIGMTSLTRLLKQGKLSPVAWGRV